MFVRKLKNRSGSISVQVISKSGGKYKVVKSLGSAKSKEKIALLEQQALQYIEQISGQRKLFIDQEDLLLESQLSNLSNSQIQVVGPELIFGKIYNHIGFNQIDDQLFRHLVLSRLYHPGSKLKTIDYLKRFQSIDIKIDRIYRFLDKLNDQLKQQIEQIAFDHVNKLSGGKISAVFYDMTTLHFESNKEDDLRIAGFSKVGKHQNPQIYLGLLVDNQGQAIGYDIYEGNTFEGHTLIPFLSKFEKRFNLKKPIVIADAGLLNNTNINELKEKGYQFILGGRIKNEAQKIKDKILAHSWNEQTTLVIKREKDKTKLIVTYSRKRAKKDAYNRQRGLERLEKKVQSGKLTKSNINNRGYNKYLRLIGKVQINIDYQKFELDAKWDGLKGYITNSRLAAKTIIDNYQQLWKIEKAFRISKTDLKIRPIYHRLRRRIEAHICISFAAYAIYKELERVLKKEKSTFTINRAAELTHNMYQITIVLPQSKYTKSILLKMDEQQLELHNLILKNF